MKILIRYLVISAFCGGLALIYNYFSHGITSPWMTFLFAWPLLLGALPAALRVRGFFPGILSGKESSGRAGPNRGNSSAGNFTQGNPGRENSSQADSSQGNSCAGNPSQGDPGREDSGRDGNGAREDEEKEEKGWFGPDLYRFGIAALTVASLLTGILEIAGTDSDYPGFLRMAGAGMLAAGALLMIVSRRRG
ncbi:MAG: hypothetical protein Q4D81_10130 [Eubacteriales bacterium]|nr:hypothetical protein [Eubacteriales bacterium]